jgi:hypothetical protein
MKRKNNESYWYAWSTLRHGECFFVGSSRAPIYVYKLENVGCCVRYNICFRRSFSRCQGFVVIVLFQKRLHKYCKTLMFSLPHKRICLRLNFSHPLKQFKNIVHGSFSIRYHVYLCTFKQLFANLFDEYHVCDTKITLVFWIFNGQNT